MWTRALTRPKARNVAAYIALFSARLVIVDDVRFRWHSIIYLSALCKGRRKMRDRSPYVDEAAHANMLPIKQDLLARCCFDTAAEHVDGLAALWVNC